MRYTMLSVLLSVLAGAIAAPSGAQAADPPLLVPHPTYQSVVSEVIINRPATAVWARVGKFCDVGEWAFYTCEIISGRDNELGTVRVVNGSIIEILAGRSALSYTYVKPVRAGVPYDAMHGTLEARPIGPRMTALVYAHVFDNSLLADDAARAADLAARKVRINRALGNMKVLAEGGKLAPPPPR